MALAADFTAASPSMLSALALTSGGVANWDAATRTACFTSARGVVTSVVAIDAAASDDAARCSASASLLLLLSHAPSPTPLLAAPAPAIAATAAALAPSIAEAVCAHARAVAAGAPREGPATPEVLHAPGALMLPAALTWAAALANARASAPRTPAASAAPGEAGLPHREREGDLSRFVRLRYATAADAPTLERFVRELAAFEREPEAVVVGAAEYARDGLAAAGLADAAALAARPPMFHALIAEVHADIAGAVAAGSDGACGGGMAMGVGVGAGAGAGAEVGAAPTMTPVAMALCHASYSTWEGRSLYLEDLYVAPAFRRRGVSGVLFSALARAALAARCARLQWSVLTWNAPAVDLYDRMRAHRLEDWRLYRLYEADLRRVAWGEGEREEEGAGGDRGEAR